MIVRAKANGESSKRQVLTSGWASNTKGSHIRAAIVEYFLIEYSFW